VADRPRRTSRGQHGPARADPASSSCYIALITRVKIKRGRGRAQCLRRMQGRWCRGRWRTHPGSGEARGPCPARLQRAYPQRPRWTISIMARLISYWCFPGEVCFGWLRWGLCCWWRGCKRRETCRSRLDAQLGPGSAAAGGFSELMTRIYNPAKPKSLFQQTSGVGRQN